MKAKKLQVRCKVSWESDLMNNFSLSLGKHSSYNNEYADRGITKFKVNHLICHCVYIDGSGF